MWTKCWNCICRLTIVLMIIILFCYYYFSPIAHRTKNFIIMFFFSENISCGYYCKCNNKGNNKIITIIVIIIIIINHHHKLFLDSFYCFYNYWQKRKRCEELCQSYKYNQPIRGAIFNFNKLVSDLDIETCNPDS